MSRTSPKVSVITCVHNGERFLAPAVESILGQDFGDFEYWIVDDASTDGSRGLLDAYRHDPRLRVLTTERNVGPYQAANLALARARGEYVARMDADDLSLPERLALQVGYLDTHPEVGLLGSRYQPIDERGEARGAPGGTISDSRELRWTLLFRNPIAHSTVIYRRTLAGSLGGYGPTRLSQDYDLWARMSFVAEVAQLPVVTVRYRLVDTGLTVTRWAAQRAASAEVSVRALARLLARRADDPELLGIAQRYYGLDDCSPAQVRLLVDFVLSLVEPFCRRFGYAGRDRDVIRQCAHAVVLWAVRNKETEAPLWAMAEYLRLLAANPRSPARRRLLPALGKLLVGVRALHMLRRLKTAVWGRRLSVGEVTVSSGGRP
jgi:glycosyltransferase involved in cell wall biosynthesis